MPDRQNDLAQRSKSRLGCQLIAATKLSGIQAYSGNRYVAEECPVSISFNGISYAVLMATPYDLIDLALGFALTDGIAAVGEVRSIEQSRGDASIELDVLLDTAALARFLRHRERRSASSYTSCGICGIRSVNQLRSPPRTGPTEVRPDAIRRALADLPGRQVINQATGAVHAAAWADPDGRIMLVREDVGRHNALDKLIGAGLATSYKPQHGFCIVTSRCSYEMVQKAAAAGMGLLVCISAPTALAVEQARLAGLALVALARADSQLLFVGQIFKH